jgi:thiamine-monophosphate kinase
MLNEVLENLLIERLARGFDRSSLQLNDLQESDAELIRVPGTEVVLALKTDVIVEEIETGLYDDPYLIGWMAVIVNASDLSAVGALPLGVLLTETIPAHATAGYIASLQAGIRDACEECGFHVFGGDTNFSVHVQVGAFAVGVVPMGLPVTRMGCQPGDALYASGRLGQGSAYAFHKLKGDGEADTFFRPTARLREGQVLRPFASCCMDTSDGALATLDQLMRLNRVGFTLTMRLEDMLHPDAVALASRAALPLWMLLAGPHGEFELLFTIPLNCEARFLDSAAAIGWNPLRIGTVESEPAVRLATAAGSAYLETGRIRNLFGESGGQVDAFLEGLHRLQPGLAALDDPARGADTGDA